MIGFFKYLLKFVAIILIVSFLALNRQETTLYYSPLNDPLTLPLWLMGLVLFAFGFTIGALLLWLNSWPIKKELSRTRKQLKEAEKDRETLGETLHDNQMEALEKHDT